MVLCERLERPGSGRLAPGVGWIDALPPTRRAAVAAGGARLGRASTIQPRVRGSNLYYDFVWFASNLARL